MKTIILVFLLSVMAFGQSGKSVLTQAQKDSIQAMINLSTSTNVGAVTLSNYNDLDDAITSISTDNKLLIIDQDATISTGTTIPSNINLTFANGAVFTVTDTLTVGGYIDNSLSQKFNVTGFVDLSNSLNAEVYPQWFGAKDDSTDGYVTGKAFQDAVNSLGSSGKKLFIPEGTYLVQSYTYYSINTGENVNWQGAGKNKTILSFPRGAGTMGQAAIGDTVVRTNHNNRNYEFRDFQIQGDTSILGDNIVQSGITTTTHSTGARVKSSYVKDVIVENFNSVGINLSDTDDGLIEGCRVINCGKYAGAAITLVGINCRIKNNFIDRAIYGLEVLSRGFPDYPDTTYTYNIDGNIIQSQYYGIRFSMGDLFNISNNTISWVNLTGVDQDVKQGYGINPTTHHIETLKIENNLIKGYEYQLYFDYTLAYGHVDTTSYLGDVSVRGNYFGEAGNVPVYYNKTWYGATGRLTIENNNFYYWRYNQGAVLTIPAIYISGISNVLIKNNLTWTLPSKTSIPVWAKNIDTLEISNNRFSNYFTLQGTNTNVRVFGNTYPPNVSTPYKFYTGSVYENKTQSLGIEENGILVKDIGIYSGSTTPEDTLDAPAGSVFYKTDGNKYVKLTEIGSDTGWVLNPEERYFETTITQNGSFDTDTSYWSSEPGKSLIKYYDTDWNGVGRTNCIIDSSIAAYPDANNVRVLDTLFAHCEEGESYRLTFDYYIPSSNITTTHVAASLHALSPTKTYLPTFLQGGLDEWLTYTLTFTTTTSEDYELLRLWQGTESGTVGLEQGDIVYFDNVKLQKVSTTQTQFEKLNINMPSDSTGLNTGDLYFDSSGNVKRKY